MSDDKPTVRYTANGVPYTTPADIMRTEAWADALARVSPAPVPSSAPAALFVQWDELKQDGTARIYFAPGAPHPPEGYRLLTPADYEASNEADALNAKGDKAVLTSALASIASGREGDPVRLAHAVLRLVYGHEDAAWLTRVIADAEASARADGWLTPCGVRCATYAEMLAHRCDACKPIRGWPDARPDFADEINAMGTVMYTDDPGRDDLQAPKRHDHHSPDCLLEGVSQWFACPECGRAP